jgi:Na+/melibiose symporter-like transporter
MRRTLVSLRVGVSGLGLGLTALLLAAPAALAADGEGLYGKTDDKVITFVCFGVIAFFAVLVTVLSLIQMRLDARKERRRSDLERLS